MAEPNTPLLTLKSLQLALGRCMDRHPPEGLDRRLHPDASLIADLWGLMIYLRQDAVPRAEVKPKILEAYGRWAVSDP